MDGPFLGGVLGSVDDWILEDPDWLAESKY